MKKELLMVACIQGEGLSFLHQNLVIRHIKNCDKVYETDCRFEQSASLYVIVDKLSMILKSVLI